MISAELGFACSRHIAPVPGWPALSAGVRQFGPTRARRSAFTVRVRRVFRADHIFCASRSIQAFLLGARRPQGRNDHITLWLGKCQVLRVGAARWRSHVRAAAHLRSGRPSRHGLVCEGVTPCPRSRVGRACLSTIGGRPVLLRTSVAQPIRPDRGLVINEARRPPQSERLSVEPPPIAPGFRVSSGGRRGTRNCGQTALWAPSLRTVAAAYPRH